ncbi:MAG: MATE family efflux transporter [Prevotella sp.]|nr:MATE family efflux transporter [Prevotella sp.]
MVFSLLLVRYSIKYLDSSLYGLWITIASIAAWANACDLGISNGLRNELAKAIANEDYLRQKNLIYTAVIMLTKLSLVIFFGLTVLTECFFIFGIMNSIVRIPMYITNITFCITFALGISRSVAYSYQKSWLASFAQSVTVLLQICGILLLSGLNVVPNLVIFSIFNGLGGILGNAVVVLLLWLSLRKKLFARKDVSYDTTHRNAIMNIGLQFFLIQLSCIALYSTDNVIINKLFDSQQVTKYAIITQVYNAGESIFSLILISLWSAVTYMATKEEWQWIKKEIRLIQKIWIVFAGGVIAVSLFFNHIVQLWLGHDAMYYEPDIVSIFCIYTILMTFGAIYVNVTNGLGRIKMQLICSVISGIINIPLSVFFASWMNLGLLGIKLATLLCLYCSIVLIPIDIEILMWQKLRKKI